MEVNELYCIGSNKYGQAGAGKKYHNQVFKQPKTLVYPTFIKEVACGSHHSALLTIDGLVYMTGSNIHGTLGVSTSSTNYSYSPILVPQLLDVSKISSGYFHMCAINQQGVYSWGKGIDGQLGTGKQVNCSLPTKIAVLGSDIEDVSCGSNHTLVKTSKGKCYSFGNGIYGQLGVGNNKNSSEPILIPLEGVDEISAGDCFSLFLKNAVVYGAGDNSHGQISSKIKKKCLLEPTSIEMEKIVIIRACKFSIAVSQNRETFVWGLPEKNEIIRVSSAKDNISNVEAKGFQMLCMSADGVINQFIFDKAQDKMVIKKVQIQSKAILGFSVGETHAIVLGDIVGEVPLLEEVSPILQTLEQIEVQRSTKGNVSNKFSHLGSQKSESSSISSEHFLRTPSSILRQPSNFLKQSDKNVNVGQFLKQCREAGSGTIKKDGLNIAECYGKIDEIMEMLQKNNLIEESRIKSSAISRKQTKSKLNSSSLSNKQNKETDRNSVSTGRNEKINRDLIMQLRDKQLKISELQDRLSKKQIEIQSQRQLIKLLRKISTRNQ